MQAAGGRREGSVALAVSAVQPGAPWATRLGVHYGWIVAGAAFVAILVAAGVRAAPGVLIKPLEGEFGWDRAETSFAVAIGFVTYGLGAPLAGSLIDRVGIRRLMAGGLVVITFGLAPLVLLQALWQLDLLWGVVVGLGTGGVANVLGATIAHRWFATRRGAMVGLFAAANSAGQLIFLPAITLVVLIDGWRGALILLLAATALVAVLVALLMRDRPEDIGLRPVGADAPTAPRALAADTRTTPLRTVVRTHDFWLLAGSFFICGYTSTGLIGTHLIPHAVEHGFTEVQATSSLALMGMMNVFGTLASGWLTDRKDARKLLAAYYGFRALSLAALPLILEFQYLLLFAVVFGLDYIATVPPTTHLTAARFGRGSLGPVLGWIYFSHMVGAGLAAYLGGVFRDVVGDYHLAFISAALLGFVAVAFVSRMSPAPIPNRRRAAVAAA